MKNYLIFSSVRYGKKAYLAEIEFLDPSILPPIIAKYKKYTCDDKFFWRTFEVETECWEGRKIVKDIEKFIMNPVKLIPYKILRVLQYAVGTSKMDKNFLTTKNRINDPGKFTIEDSKDILPYLTGKNEIYFMPDLYLENAALFKAETDDDAYSYFKNFISTAILDEQVNQCIRFTDMSNWENMLNYSAILHNENYDENSSYVKNNLKYNKEVFRNLISTDRLNSYESFSEDDFELNDIENEISKQYSHLDIFDFNNSIEEIHKGYMFNGAMTHDVITKSLISMMGAIQNRDFKLFKDIFEKYFSEKAIVCNHVFDEIKDVFPVPVAHIFHIFGCSEVADVNIISCLPNKDPYTFISNPKYLYVFDSDTIVSTPSSLISDDIDIYYFRDKNPSLKLKDVVLKNENNIKSYRKERIKKYVRRK